MMKLVDKMKSNELEFYAIVASHRGGLHWEIKIGSSQWEPMGNWRGLNLNVTEALKLYKCEGYSYFGLVGVRPPTNHDFLVDFSTEVENLIAFKKHRELKAL